MKKFLKENATLIALIALGIILTIMTSISNTDGKVVFNLQDSVFFNSRNLNNLTRQVTLIGIISIGMTMVILLGGIDLSVGSIVGLSGVVVAIFMMSGMNMWLAIFLTLVLTGVLIGILNGFMIAHYKIPPFIITLGMMTIARGLALIFSNNSSIPINDTFFPVLGGEYIPKMISLIIILIGFAYAFLSIFLSIKKKKSYGIEVKPADVIWNISMTIVGTALAIFVFYAYRGIPLPVAIFIILIIIGEFILRKTRLGRSIYAVGGNEQAARLSGISIFKINLVVYTVVSALSSLSGILLVSRLNGAAPTLGNMFELDAIASVVIGGTSLNGGSGTIKGTIIGTFIIGFLNNGMSLLNVDTSYQFVIKGIIIILAVWFDVMNKKKKI